MRERLKKALGAAIQPLKGGDGSIKKAPLLQAYIRL